MTPNANPLREGRSRGPRQSSAQRIALTSVFAILFLVTLRLLLAPDPSGELLFARAERLEAAGLARPALRQYHLLAQTHPESARAPEALSREAALWLGFARDGEATAFTEAVKTYRTLASTYPGTQNAGQALLQIGKISLNDLVDIDDARAAYEEALKGYANNRAVAAEATLCLGVVAQRDHDGKTAQTRFQQVLTKYHAETGRCAQAQYALGETYETLFRNREWARNAYETTLRSYPKTVWAGKAKERLGMMLYHEAAPRARRVTIKTPSTPSETSGDTLLGGLRLVLAARGIEAGAGTLRGWSLAPFIAGYLPANPGRAPRVSPEAWETIAVNAGLRFRVYDGGDAKSALQTLQNELDAAHLTLVYSGGAWQLATGYDSARDTVVLQSGARFENPSSRDFVKGWNRSSPLGGPFGLVAFEAPGEDGVARPGEKPISAVPVAGSPSPAAPATAAPGYVKATAQQSPLAAPGYLYELKPLDEKAAHRRTLRRAAEWLRRTHDGDAVLGGEALRTIATELRRFATQSTAEAAGPGAEGGLARKEVPLEEPTARDEAAGPAGTEIVPPPDGAAANVAALPTPAAPEPVTVDAAQSLPRLRALLAWRGAPLQQWLEARRDAAAYCDIAAARLGDPSLRKAADALREALTALEDARALLPLPAAIGPALTEKNRGALAAAALKLDAAREAERRAADALDAAAR